MPFMPLTKYVTEQYNNLQKADTITLDPHKSGFCPYPAGALCYRNEAMKSFIAIMHPEVFHGEGDPTMGVYGIEGSKPGAAPTAVLASHQVLLLLYRYILASEYVNIIENVFGHPILIGRSWCLVVS